jgi:hypothetical protein
MAVLPDFRHGITCTSCSLRDSKFLDIKQHANKIEIRGSVDKLASMTKPVGQKNSPHIKPEDLVPPDVQPKEVEQVKKDKIGNGDNTYCYDLNELKKRK